MAWTEEPDEFCGGCGENLTHVVRGTRYSKATSVEIRGVYDGGLFYAHTLESGGCGFAWHRWVKVDGYRDHPEMRAKAQPFIDRWNRRYAEADPERAVRFGHSFSKSE